MRMPNQIVDQMKFMSKNLDVYIQSNGKKYTGTDPLTDANKLWMQDQKRKHQNSH